MMQCPDVVYLEYSITASRQAAQQAGQSHSSHAHAHPRRHAGQAPDSSYYGTPAHPDTSHGVSPFPRQQELQQQRYSYSNHSSPVMLEEGPAYTPSQSNLRRSHSQLPHSPEDWPAGQQQQTAAVQRQDSGYEHPRSSRAAPGYSAAHEQQEAFHGFRAMGEHEAQQRSSWGTPSMRAAPAASQQPPEGGYVSHHDCGLHQQRHSQPWQQLDDHTPQRSFPPHQASDLGPLPGTTSRRSTLPQHSSGPGPGYQQNAVCHEQQHRQHAHAPQHAARQPHAAAPASLAQSQMLRFQADAEPRPMSRSPSPIYGLQHLVQGAEEALPDQQHALRPQQSQQQPRHLQQAAHHVRHQGHHPEEQHLEHLEHLGQRPPQQRQQPQHLSPLDPAAHNYPQPSAPRHNPYHLVDAAAPAAAAAPSAADPELRRSKHQRPLRPQEAAWDVQGLPPAAGHDQEQPREPSGQQDQQQQQASALLQQLHDEGSQHAFSEAPAATASQQLGTGSKQHSGGHFNRQGSAGCATGAGHAAPLKAAQQQHPAGVPSSDQPAAGQQHSLHAEQRHQQHQQHNPAGTMGSSRPAGSGQRIVPEHDANTRSPQSGSTATLSEPARQPAQAARAASGGGLAAAAGAAPAGAAAAQQQQGRQVVQQSEGQAGSCIRRPAPAASQDMLPPTKSADAPQLSEQLSMQSTAQRPHGQQQEQLPSPDATAGARSNKVLSAAGSTPAAQPKAGAAAAAANFASPPAAVQGSSHAGAGAADEPVYQTPVKPSKAAGSYADVDPSLLQSPAVPSILVPGKSWYLHKLYGSAQSKPAASGIFKAPAAQPAGSASAAVAAAAAATSSGLEQPSMFRISAEMLQASKRSGEAGRSSGRQEPSCSGGPAHVRWLHGAMTLLAGSGVQHVGGLVMPACYALHVLDACCTYACSDECFLLHVMRRLTRCPVLLLQVSPLRSTCPRHLWHPPTRRRPTSHLPAAPRRAQQQQATCCQGSCCSSRRTWVLPAARPAGRTA
jgi:hypothetical protein